MNYMSEIRKKAGEIKEQRKDVKTDYHQMTAPCGIPCFECFAYLANESKELQTLISQTLEIPPELAVCKGCRNKEGKIDHLPMKCRVYPCAKEKEIEFCCNCSDFPCDFLHPYTENAILWHNTKVFNLCLIKKMGLEAWAKNKAGKVLDVYSFGKWTL